MFGLVPWKEEKTAFPLLNPRNEFKALFDRFFNPWPLMFEPLMERERFWGLELEETETEMVVRAELPGFAPEELEVNLRGNELLLRADKKIEVKENAKKPPYVERHYERVVTLPVETDPEKVDARYHNGVLEIRLPKPPAALVKRVPVKAT
jgi:HSP20 family protein